MGVYQAAAYLGFVALTSLSVVATTEVQAQSADCVSLWYQRNAIFKDVGYCFKTTRAIETFGNDGCRYDNQGNIPLSASQRQAINQIQREERQRNCQPSAIPTSSEIARIVGQGRISDQRTAGRAEAVAGAQAQLDNSPSQVRLPQEALRSAIQKQEVPPLPRPSSPIASNGVNDIPPPATQSKPDETASIQAATTPKNSFLIEGSLKDIIVLFNDTGKAPSVVKNLRGDLIFEASKTAACQPDSGLVEIEETRQVNARLKKWGQSLKFPLPRCNMQSLLDYDVVITTRGHLLREKPSDVVALLSAVGESAFAPMFFLTGDEVKAATQADAVRALEIETVVEKESKTGFGIVTISNGSGVVCEAAGGSPEAHELLLRPHTERLSDELGKVISKVATSPEAAFVAAKRGQCGAIYASGTDLKALTLALRRDQIPFQFLPIWIESLQLEAAQKTITEHKTKEVVQEADRRRQTEDEQRLAAVKANEESVIKAQKQSDLQRRYGALARAFEGALTAEFKDFLEGRSPTVGTKYPEVGLWYLRQLSDRWELMTVETVLIDYGVSEFKGRSLETAFARTTIRMRNRILGEYKDHCFITGFISDKEFGMDREAISVTCDDPNQTLMAYRQGQRFTSQWLVP